MTAPTMDEAAKVLVDPLAYADEPKLHAALSHLRAHAPVSWVEVPSYRPFWAITKHADIMEIERANTLFTNSPRPVLSTAEADAQHEAVGISTLIHMDDPQHRKVRAIGADWFRPKAMRALKLRIDELAKRYPLDPKRVFLVGHSMGAIHTIDLVQKHPEKFAAVAMLGGAVTLRDPKAFAELPTFVGVGEKDELMLGAVRGLNKALAGGAKKLTYKEYPHVEHMVIVREALPDVFEMFSK